MVSYKFVKEVFALLSIPGSS